ncbi:hypothetical protein [Streptomyces tropicalis]|uniref:MmpS family membrane protein n=1 Tax=Streptomyces tropicalis TaxID=3034234 RepID=A0ABT6A9U0_9ACTN|nr:hypothetical protein [Streptomyces tropicalis]MDF3301207.1 hypothetical protein [Streptomyces tropicalis]
MSYQPYPQQPDPQQGWGAPPPHPPKKGKGKIAGLGCLGVVVLICIAAAVSGGGSDKSNDSKSATSTSKQEKAAADKGGSKSDSKSNAGDTKKAGDKKTVLFKVWGTAPAGALGSLDITYGSDSDNRNGKFANGKFEATLPVNKDAMYYSVTAQLQGSGDINCSVTIGGKTKKGHASGGYNICQTQLNSGLLGGWD